MTGWAALAIFLFCGGLAFLLVTTGFVGQAWWRARHEMRSFDVEYALFTDGLWMG